MITLALAVIILLEILTYFVIFDVILSWLALAWIKRPAFVWSVLDPIYEMIKKYIPTTIWPFELTPIIVIFLFLFIKWIVILMFPEVVDEITKLSNY